MNRLLIFLLLLPFLALTACHPEPIEGGKEIAREAEMRKIKRLTPEQIFAEAHLAGDSITALATRLQRARVKKALAESGIAEALKYCSSLQNPELDSLLQQYGATIGRTSQKLRNLANKPNAQLAQLLDAYHYNAENKLPLESGVQLASNGKYIYTKAISIPDQSCLTCHGKPGAEFTAENAAIIKSAYPADQATGYQVGDLRGMWHISFSKEGLVRSIALKGQKKKRKG